MSTRELALSADEARYPRGTVSVPHAPAPPDPVQLSVRPADETIDRGGHLENEIPHGSPPGIALISYDECEASDRHRFSRVVTAVLVLIGALLVVRLLGKK